MVSIFNYGFGVAAEAFEKAGVPYISLSDYKTLIGLALEKGTISAETEQVLLEWSNAPAEWGI